MLVALGLLGVSGALAQQAAPAVTPPAATAPAATPAAPAPAAPKVDTGDTAWVLTSSALVLMMTAPGLALFYGGMVRRKNVLATLMQSFILMAVISIQWVLWGYSLAFGPDIVKSANENPDVQYAGVDVFDPLCTQKKNLTCLLFKEHEGSFLVGMAAATEDMPGRTSLSE